MNKRKFRTYEEFKLEHFKKHPEDIGQYLRIALEEYQKDGDMRALSSALNAATKIRGGVGRLAKATKLDRANLYKIVSGSITPRLDTFLIIMKHLGYSLDLKSMNRRGHL